MKRSIFVFLLAFLVTIGAGVGLYYLCPGLLAPKAPATETPSTPAEETPTTPKPTPAPTAETVPTPEPPSVEEPAPLPEPAPTLRAEEPAPTQPEPAAPTARTADEVASATTDALKATNVNDMLDSMVAQGLMSAEAAAALKAWSANHKVGSIEEVGSTTGADGSKTTRYRISCAEGKGDILLSVIATKDGRVRVQEATEAPSDRTQISATSDPLTVVEGFLAAVKKGDMGTACRMVTGEEVSNATIAGLCMIFGEGEFALRAHDPIRGTFATASNAGYLVYLTDLSHPEDTRPRNIGIEMLRTPEAWRVSGLGLDALLSAYEEQGYAEGGRYFPIVKNPKGGDSLALFFAFNEYGLTPRSLRQLGIVAELLKQTGGKLNISGHTDDVGSEKYNLTLSENRAAAVKEALVGYGVNAEQITTHGLGKSQPRRTYNAEDSEKEIDYIRGENRRAEIYLDFES